jgi:hypothetical protein
MRKLARNEHRRNIDRALKLAHPVVTRAAEKRNGTGSKAKSAPFCPRVFLLSAYRPEGWLVGAVGIEKNSGRDFKDLRGMRRNAKSLKRNDGERSVIHIAPLMLPRFRPSRNSLPYRFRLLPLTVESASGPNLAARMASQHKNHRLAYYRIARRSEPEATCRRPSRNVIPLGHALPAETRCTSDAPAQNPKPSTD